MATKNPTRMVAETVEEEDEEEESSESLSQDEEESEDEELVEIEASMIADCGLNASTCGYCKSKQDTSVSYGRTKCKLPRASSVISDLTALGLQV